MDALDELVERCRSLAVTAEGPSLVEGALRQTDLASILDSVLARRRPWFFEAGPELSVFATAAAPGTGSAPHDHGLWAVIASLAGREGSRRYTEHEGRLCEAGVACLESGGVHRLPTDAIHAVFNCWTEPNVVLHVYGGDFLTAAKRVWDPITGAVSPLGLSEPLAPIGGAS